MESLRDELDQLYLEITFELRSTKVVNDEAMARVLEIIEVLKEDWRGEPLVDRKTIARLHSLFIFMMGEAAHAKNPDPIERESWRLCDRIRRLLSEE